MRYIDEGAKGDDPQDRVHEVYGCPCVFIQTHLYPNTLNFVEASYVSGWGKCGISCPGRERYSKSCIRTTENPPSRHFGE
jgi:hypothetical protein